MHRVHGFITGAVAAATAVVGSTASASYVQLADFSDIAGATGASILVGGTVIGGDAYFTVSGGGNHAVTSVGDVGGTNAHSVVVGTTAWNANFASAPNGISGNYLGVSGGLLQFHDIITGQVYRVNPTLGVVSSVYLTAPTIGQQLGGTPNTLLIGSVDASNGEHLFYVSQAARRGIYGTTGGGSFQTILSGATLTSEIGSNQINGLTSSASGVIYFGSNNATTPSLFAFDQNTSTLSVVSTVADIESELGVTGSGSNAFGNTQVFHAPDGRVYLRWGRGINSIVSIDPLVGASSAQLVLSSQDLLDGPAASNNVGNFAWWNGQLAWTQTIGAGSQVVGFYTIPEPTTLALLAAGSMLALRRRRVV
jgi:hypothetical protein